MKGSYTGLQILLAPSLALAAKCEPRDAEPKWADISASSTLKWVPCYNKAECARLEVPMDYDNPEGAKVTLAVLRHPATEKDNYKGPVLFNPGGPNTSGIDWFLNWANDLHNTVGRNHDIVTWDARSYSRSTPRISCWATEQRRNLWAATSPDFATQYDDDAFLATMKYRAEIENSACVDMMGETGILEHVSTSQSARDLHALMTALGQKKIRYLGQSYGCLLGAYFGSMFPDKIERLACEGNVDPREVVSSRFVTEPNDLELVIDFIIESCAANEKCALHEPTAEAVRERFEAIFEKALHEPGYLPFASPFDYPTQQTAYAVALGVLQQIIPNPYRTFPTVAKLLAAIEAGGISTPESLLSSEPWAGASAYLDTTYRSPLDPDAGRKGFDNRYPLTEDWTTCNDLAVVPDDLEAFKKELEKAKAIGSRHAVQFARLLNCMGRKFRGKGMYTGPFGGNTSHPILFTNARYDPSTSVKMAYSNSKQFPGSGLLVYEAYGHSMVFRSPCVVKHINTYFQNGTLPAKDAKCADKYEMVWE